MVLVNYASPAARNRHVVTIFHSALDKDVLIDVPPKATKVFLYPFQVDLITGNVTRGEGSNLRSGAKSTALERKDIITRDMSAVSSEHDGLDLGLLTLPRSEILSAVFVDFLMRVGASHDNPESAEAILNSEFNNSEIKSIRDALQPFDRTYIAIRADECTVAGTGLWHTGFLAYTRDRFKLALEIVRQILASEFSPSVTAFKRRTGLPMDETPGVLIQPMILGDCGWAGGVFTTPLHVNAITHFHDDDCFISIGTGIGGANQGGALTMMLSQLSERRINPREILDNIRVARVFHGNQLLRADRLAIGLRSETVFEAIMGYIECNSKVFVSTLRTVLGMISERHSSPLYLEFGFEDPRFPVLFQCADISLGHVDKPVIQLGKKF